MSKLDQLIEKHCPNGVKYVAIKDYFTRLKGTPITAGKMKEIESPDGDIRIFAGGKTVINAHEEDIPNANITRVPAVLVQSRGVIDFIYYEKPFTFKNEMWAYTHKNPITVKYLYHFFKNNTDHFRDAASGMGSLPQISLPVTEKYMIPIPPIEVQQEIVRILDCFTKLSEELSAELTVRKKQYEYYRDQLLDFNDEECQWRTLGDICLITDGSHFSPKEVENGYYMPSVKDMRNNGFDYSACKRISQADYELLVRNGCRPQANDVLIAKDGATMLKHAFVSNGTEDIVILSSIAILRPDTSIIFPQYLAHYFRQERFKETVIRNFSSVGGVPRIVLKNFKRIKLPIPPMEEQKRIVKILDCFDYLCNDTFIGLPAEIEVRKKQYEYYRDKLLSFTEM